jgi:hypothetical protein
MTSIEYLLHYRVFWVKLCFFVFERLFSKSCSRSIFCFMRFKICSRIHGTIGHWCFVLHAIKNLNPSIFCEFDFMIVCMLIQVSLLVLTVLETNLEMHKKMFKIRISKLKFEVYHGFCAFL